MDPRCHQASEGGIVAGGSIGPDVAMASWPGGPSLVRALTAAPRYEIHALLSPRSRRCLPLLRGSTSLRDRRCPVLVVTMAIVMVVFIGLFDGRASRNLEWTDQARGPASPRSPSRNG